LFWELWELWEYACYGKRYPQKVRHIGLLITRMVRFMLILWDLLKEKR